MCGRLGFFVLQYSICIYLLFSYDLVFLHINFVHNIEYYPIYEIQSLKKQTKQTKTNQTKTKNKNKTNKQTPQQTNKQNKTKTKIFYRDLVSAENFQSWLIHTHIWCQKKKD